MTTNTANGTIDEIESGMAALKGNPLILSKVVGTFVDREIDRRVKILVTGIEALQAAQKMLDGINKPDLKSYATADDQEPTTLGFSDRKKQDIEKQRKIVRKLADAVNAALANANFSALEQAIKNKGAEEPAAAA